MEKVGYLIDLALKNYFKINKYLPENIIFYRDGVSDS
ncbi:MAG: hypothetical protein ACK52J_04270 [bacterium]|jgi:hypothetical protein